MGDKPPFYRSSWEYRMCHYLDSNVNVLRWHSENVIIPYTWVDNKTHKYYTDFYVEIRNRDGNKETLVLEIKPKDQVPHHPDFKIPKPPRKKTVKSMKNYQNRLLTLKKNELKWEAAEIFCKKKGWKFSILTEDDLYIN